ncbi:MAG TPA: succinate dehydrogenase, cytochrome b556 subunit [Casimicrobiaceae bacterium]
MRRNDMRARGHPAYWAFVVHRVSGLALTLFLPLHFWALSRALDPAALDRFLAWTRQPPVRMTELAIVVALAAHLAGGVRLLLVEFVGWRADLQKSALALAAGFTLAIGLLLAFNP